MPQFSSDLSRVQCGLRGRRGERGVPGPEGPQGPQGPQGPAGPVNLPLDYENDNEITNKPDIIQVVEDALGDALSDPSISPELISAIVAIVLGYLAGSLPNPGSLFPGLPTPGLPGWLTPDPDNPNVPPNPDNDPQWYVPDWNMLANKPIKEQTSGRMTIQTSLNPQFLPPGTQPDDTPSVQISYNEFKVVDEANQDVVFRLSFPDLAINPETMEFYGEPVVIRNALTNEVLLPTAMQQRINYNNLDNLPDLNQYVTDSDLGNAVDDLENQINNISLTPGPEGPQGPQGPEGPPGSDASVPPWIETQLRRADPQNMGNDTGVYSNFGWLRLVTNGSPIRFYTDGDYGTNFAMTVEPNGDLNLHGGNLLNAANVKSWPGLLDEGPGSNFPELDRPVGSILLYNGLSENFAVDEELTRQLFTNFTEVRNQVGTRQLVGRWRVIGGPIEGTNNRYLIQRVG